MMGYDDLVDPVTRTATLVRVLGARSRPVCIRHAGTARYGRAGAQKPSHRYGLPTAESDSGPNVVELTVYDRGEQFLATLRRISKAVIIESVSRI